MEPTLTTEKLTLRQLHNTDTEEIFLLRSNKTVNQYIHRTPPENLKEASDFIWKITEDKNNNNMYFWVIVLKEKNNFVGTICLWNFSENRKTAEIGFELFPEFHNQGIMSDAIVEVINFAFEELELESIEAFTHRNNLSSIKMLSNKKFLKDTEKTDPENKNNIIYILTPQKWGKNGL